MGTAAMGIENCTCQSEQTFSEFEQEQYNTIVRSLQTEKKELEQENARLNRVIKNLLKHKVERKQQIKQ